jgi:hypothetical protein
MKAPVFFSALVATTFGSSAVLATAVSNINARSPLTVKVQARTNKPKPDDVSLKAWIDRGQDIQVSLSVVNSYKPSCPLIMLLF